MLGFLHKRILGNRHPAMCAALICVTDTRFRYHDKSLESHFDEVSAYRALYDRSIWTYILIYNRLPQELVNSSSVSVFQARLTRIAKHRAQSGDPDWRGSYQSCSDVVSFFYGNNNV